MVLRKKSRGKCNKILVKIPLPRRYFLPFPILSVERWNSHLFFQKKRSQISNQELLFFTSQGTYRFEEKHFFNSPCLHLHIGHRQTEYTSLLIKRLNGRVLHSIPPRWLIFQGEKKRHVICKNAPYLLPTSIVG